jgi:hypothetical protein
VSPNAVSGDFLRGFTHKYSRYRNLGLPRVSSRIARHVSLNSRHRASEVLVDL